MHVVSSPDLQTYQTSQNSSRYIAATAIVIRWFRRRTLREFYSLSSGDKCVLIEARDDAR